MQWKRNKHQSTQARSIVATSFVREVVLYDHFEKDTGKNYAKKFHLTTTQITSDLSRTDIPPKIWQFLRKLLAIMVQKLMKYLQEVRALNLSMFFNLIGKELDEDTKRKNLPNKFLKNTQSESKILWSAIEPKYKHE